MVDLFAPAIPICSPLLPCPVAQSHVWHPTQSSPASLLLFSRRIRFQLTSEEASRVHETPLSQTVTTERTSGFRLTSLRAVLSTIGIMRLLV